MSISWGLSRADSRHLKGVFRVPERHENRKGSIGPGWPTLSTKAAKRFHMTRKVVPQATRYQGQHLSCEWVIEASILRPSNPTHGTCYWVLAVHGGSLAKMSDRGATPHCGKIVKPRRKARRHIGHAVRDQGKMLAY
ncbi:UNVERIFIED_CONTAM: hypothetical protein Sindi_1595000 [Sesamum indicum]